MNNKERYKRAFSSVRTSADYCKGVFEMDKTRKAGFHLPRAAVACLAVCLVLGAAGVCYAADVGGIQRQVQIWIYGDRTDAVIEFDGEGGYQMEYKDADGNTVSRGGGGVAFDAFGNERPLTEEELMDMLDAPDVRYGEDGRVTMYYCDQAVDITDLFDDGVCYIKLVRDGKELYVTVKYRDGYAYSPKHYIAPESFNTDPNLAK